MTWLVTGGAGYIGSHVVHAMQAAGVGVVVLDDMSSEVQSRVDGVPLVVGSVLDRPLVERALHEHSVRGIVHLAAKKARSSSSRSGVPLFYYEQNVDGPAASCCRRRPTRASSAVRLLVQCRCLRGRPDHDLVTEDVGLPPR